MSNQENPQRFPWGVIVGAAAALAVVGGSLAWFASQQLKPSSSPVTTEPTPSQTITESTPPASNGEAQQQAIAVYWLKVSPAETQLQPASITVNKSADKSQILTTAFKQLLTGPSDANYTTTITPGTKLLDLKVDREGVHLDLSQEFTREDGSAMMIGRLAQVIYTASSLDPSVPVWISVEGQPLEVLGEGHGLIVDQPMTRELFSKNYQL